MEKEAKNEKGAGAAADPRFAAVQYDPRFQRFPRAKSTVQVDDRFAGMFNDPAFQTSDTVDKRGRKIKNKKNKEDMRRYYRLKDEDEWKKEDANKKQEEATISENEKEPKLLKAAPTAGKKKTAAATRELAPPSESSSSEEEEEDEAAQLRWARMRGLAGPDSSSDESGSGDDEQEEEQDHSDEEGSQFDSEGEQDESGSEEVEEEDEAAVAEFGIGVLAANPREKIPLLPDATSRLACVDLDWENVRAVDILVALRSFLPRGGAIRSVTVYPSDYGLERMAAEAKSGPQGIWRRKEDRKKVALDSGSEEESEKEVESAEESDSDDDGADGEVDMARLRLYERSKLRWYYAIVECDSKETANQLYDECDGMELMKTACIFDLRFVPDGQSFKSRQVRDTATSVPSDYEAPTFQTKALQHTNVELTWDKGDEGRKRALTRKLTADEIKEDDFKAYLATDSDGSDGEGGSDSDGNQGGGLGGKEENAEAIRERYMRLLLGGAEDAPKERKGKKDWDAADGGDLGKKAGSDEEDSDEDGGDDNKNMEMEVTFASGLEGLGERLIAKRKEAEAKAGETVWEAYMRRKREKKAEAKRLGKVNIESDDDDSEDYSQGGTEGESDSDSDADGDGDDALHAGVADDPFFQHEEDPFNDPFFQNDPSGGQVQGDTKKKGKDKGKKGGKKEATEDDDEETARREKAELEMLLLDESALLRKAAASARVGNGDASGQPAKKLSKKERMRLKKASQRQERAGGSDDEDHEEAAGAGFKVNLEDPRFKELITAPEFALDPTDPRFAKAGPGTAAIATEVAKRRSTKLNRNTAAGAEGKKKEGGKGEGQGVEGGNKADLKFMVASLKRKAAVMGASAPGGGSAAQTGGKKKKTGKGK